MTSETLQKAREFEAANRPHVPEELRQAFHFTPAVGWMNDPNGFSVYRGEYHLFYQYYPFSSSWGPMHWGHARSRDFLNWDYLPAALAPDREYDKDGCWSGSAAELDDGRQLILYTGRSTHTDGCTYQAQCLAVGDGRDYEKREENPVLTAADLPEGCSPYDFRDPKMWREADGTFRAVAVTRTGDGSGAALLYRSQDGFAWQLERVIDACRNEYGRMWECPDFFPLDGKQVLLVSPMELEAREPDFHAGFGTIAILGRETSEPGRDGKADGSGGQNRQSDAIETGGGFVRESVQALDHGPDFYAAQTMKTPDGRRVMIAWMQNWGSAREQPDQRLCRAGMTLPRELSLREGRLTQNPVRELEAWRRNSVSYRNIPVSAARELDGVRGRVLDLCVTIRPGEECTRFRVSVAADGTRRTAVEYLPERGLVRVERDASDAPGGVDHARAFPVRARDGALDLRLILDRHSLEVFVGGGEQAASFLLYAPLSADGIRFEAEGGTALLDADCWTLEKPDI